MKNMIFEELNEIDKDLIEKAAFAMKNSYSPYSNFKVGAAVLTEDGFIFIGTNVENSSFGATLCAERVAIGNAVSNGHKKIIKIGIISESNDVITPCGICRQVIFEFAKHYNNDIEILMSNKNKRKIVSSKISEILPLGFDFNVL